MATVKTATQEPRPAPDPKTLLMDHIIDTDMEMIPVLVDGELARDILAWFNLPPKPGKKGTNRKPSPIRIKRYTGDMNNGEWFHSPQPIILSEPNAQGKVEQSDGQQRLMSLVEASKTNPDIALPFWFCINSPLSNKLVLDTGKPKSSADFLRMEGEANANPLAYAAKLLHCWHNIPYTSADAWRAARFSSQMQEELLAKHPGLRQGVTIAMDLRSLVRPQITAVAWYLIDQEYDAFKAAEFINGLETGADLGINDARLRFRNFLARAAVNHRKWEGYEQLALMVKAFNAWMLKDEDFTPTFKKNEKFPVLLTHSKWKEITETLDADLKVGAR